MKPSNFSLALAARFDQLGRRLCRLGSEGLPMVASPRPVRLCLKGGSEKSRFPWRSKSKSDSIGHGYYLRPGKLVLVVETDAASALSRIRMNGAASPLWTATRNLSSRPVKNARGVIESPESTGLRPR